MKVWTRACYDCAESMSPVPKKLFRAESVPRTEKYCCHFFLENKKRFFCGQYFVYLKGFETNKYEPKDNI